MKILYFFRKSRVKLTIFWEGELTEKRIISNIPVFLLKNVKFQKFGWELRILLLNSLEGGAAQTARYATINDDTHFMTFFVVSMIRYNFVESSMSKEQLSVLEFSFSEKKWHAYK